MFSRDVGVIGGAGHVGLPLALMFADHGVRTVIYDTNVRALERIARGEMPHAEAGGQEMLERVLRGGFLEITAEPAPLRDCEFWVMTIGTPVDEHLNPSFAAIRKALGDLRSFLRDGQVLVLRSTVYPGTSEQVQRSFDRDQLRVGVSFCPERVAQGHSLDEFRRIPQIVSGFDDETRGRVETLFAPFTSEFVRMQPTEAELCKLMTNAWRYIQFATVNQFYMIATLKGLDFERILHGCRHNYPRMAGMPGPGLSAGPCLVKDTMQLAAYSQNSFVLGHSAMLINEGLPAHLIDLAKRSVDLRDKTAGILGMAFKAESDDGRDSLSYKLRKLLQMDAREVLCTDPFVADPSLVSLERVIEESNVLFVATPHEQYRGLRIAEEKVVIDVWNCVESRRP
ncbi:MAG TPA: nucleotide sugar dehydrogenase [Thermoanaerobaculia bacterium]